MKFIKDNLALITAIATALATITASVLGANEKIVNSTILLVIILIALLVARRKSDIDAHIEQKPLYTLRTNTLPPSKTKKFLGIKTNLVFVAAKDSRNFFEDLRKELQLIHDDLEINHFVDDSLDQDLQQSRLLDVLDGADAVIVVRTTELENQPWVYEGLDAWARQNSNIPILVIDKIKKVEPSGLPLRLNPIPEKFYVIPDDPASMPWRLLKIATERSIAWRNQASFNRSIALALLILALAGLLVGYLTNSSQRRRYDNLLQQQKRDNYKQLQSMYTVIAEHTKKDYQDYQVSIGEPRDEKLNVSYWISYQGTYYQLSSSEEEYYQPWPSTKQSIIGCVLAGPNRTALWDSKMARPLVSLFNTKAIAPDSNCGYGDQRQRTLKSIVCASDGDSENPDPDGIVGVCIFTESEINNVSKGSPLFIQQRVREFYQGINPFLKDKKLTPQ
jgi:hypothetical protein